MKNHVLLLCGLALCTGFASAAETAAANTAPGNGTAPTSAEVARNPDAALKALKEGNARFYNNTARRPELSAFTRRAQIASQSPFAIILGCSDSRVPAEIVFDQGLGNLFISRVAGNVAIPGTIGSLEYGVAALKSNLIVVLGHESCGAVVAAMQPADKTAGLPSGVKYILNQISPSVGATPVLRDTKARNREAIIANVRSQVAVLKANPTIASAIKSGQIKVVGGIYEIGSGAVDFFETDEELRLNEAERTAVARQIAANARVENDMMAITRMANAQVSHAHGDHLHAGAGQHTGNHAHDDHHDHVVIK